MSEGALRRGKMQCETATLATLPASPSSWYAYRPFESVLLAETPWSCNIARLRYCGETSTVIQCIWNGWLICAVPQAETGSRCDDQDHKRLDAHRLSPSLASCSFAFSR
jgi:hypothetical protein